MIFKCPECGAVDNLEEVWFGVTASYKINLSWDIPSTLDPTGKIREPRIEYDDAESQVMCGNCYYELEGVETVEDLCSYLYPHPEDKPKED
jgi:hypothetical protein